MKPSWLPRAGYDVQTTSNGAEDAHAEPQPCRQYLEDATKARAEMKLGVDKVVLGWWERGGRSPMHLSSWGLAVVNTRDMMAQT